MSEQDEQPNRVPAEVEVSVCITTYNHAGFIAQAIESVLIQRTSFAFEILIGEDDSTDETGEICRRYAAAHPDRIRLFMWRPRDASGVRMRPSNGALTDAAARGKYKALLEGDDFWIDPEKLEKQYQFMRRNPQVPMCGARCLAWDRFGKTPAKIIPAQSLGGFVSRQQIAERGAYVHTSTFFARADAYTRPAWASGVLLGDMTMQFTLARTLDGIPVLPDVMSVYRATGGGVWSGANGDQRDAILSAFWEAYIAGQGTADEDPGALKLAMHRLQFLRFKQKYRKRLGPLYPLALMVCHPRTGIHYIMHAAGMKLAILLRLI